VTVLGDCLQPLSALAECQAVKFAELSECKLYTYRPHI